jgi:LysR family hydrogen peroxide-inducible transcriptional activator
LTTICASTGKIAITWLMRFGDPQPRRVVGLAWRRSSPRKRHFVELGKLIISATSGQMRDSELV